MTENLIGQTFGRWTVMARGPNDSRRKARWYCQCCCGNPDIKLVRGDGLKSGQSQSCGCLQRESAQRHNIYDMSQEYAIGYTNKGEEFWVDKDDVPITSQYCWHYTPYGYLRSWDSKNQTFIFLHCLVMGFPDGDVDHIRHPPRREHKVDNRKSNLRVVTRSQNAVNGSLRVNNRSGCTGVCRQNGKYMAYIWIDNHNVNLGIYDKIEDAIKARKEAETKYYGEYRYDANN